MDNTARCRDKCASSANMISCMNDCQGKTPMRAAAGFFRAHTPKLLGNMGPQDKKKAVICSIAIVAVVVGVLYMKNKKKGGAQLAGV